MGTAGITGTTGVTGIAKGARPARRGVWLVALALVALVVQVVFRGVIGDVGIYRAGAHHLLDGQLYLFRDVKNHGFTYPPFAAIVMAALAWLPTRGMWLALDVLSAGAMMLLLRVCVTTPLRGRPRDVAMCIAVLLVAQPVTATFCYGQINLLLAAAVMVDLLVLRNGVLVGLATAMKLTPGLFIVYLLALGRVREAAVAAATFAASIGLGLIVTPSAASHYWTHTVLDGSGIGPLDRPGNQSLRGLAERVAGVGGGTVVWAILVVPTALLGIALARAVARSGQEVLAAGIAGVTACIVSPMSWTHHWVWIIPVAGGLMSATYLTPRVRSWLRFSAVVLIVWTILPGGFQSAPVLRLVGAGYVPLAVALAVVCLRAARRGPGEADEPSARPIVADPMPRAG